MISILWRSPLSGCQTRISLTLSSARSLSTTATMSKRARSTSTDDVLKHPSTKVAKKVDQNPPMAQLDELLRAQKDSSGAPRNVLHWFRSKDLRIEDNKALHAASKRAKEGKGSLITCYLVSFKDMEWHGTSPARSDFILESLREVRDKLHSKNIPLAILNAEERADKSVEIMDFVKKHDVSHVFANLEYEVDELRRDIKLVNMAKDEDDLTFELLHDQTVVTPGQLRTGGAGGPMKVFTPYHKAWLVEVKENPNLLDLAPAPEGNGKDAKTKLKELFDTSFPSLPKTKQHESMEERDRHRKLWPAGHDAGIKRLNDFLKNKVSSYASDRSNASKDPSSRLSAYFSSGVISVREALAAAQKANGSADFDDSGDAGIASWARELVFREFYRHTMVHAPHGGMNLPQNLKFDNVQWEADEEGWKRWCEGRTGVPFVDAGMRQLNHEAYMHNRLRMNTSSYLSANLLIDYRRGERYFAEHLVDWDLCNNTNGWEPSYTVFNPVTQAEKHDPAGDYIRRWVPELKHVEGRAIYAPHARLSKEEFEKLGYPAPHVDFNESKARATQRYKRDLADADP